MNAIKTEDLPSASGNPTFVWDHDRRRIVNANAAALRFWDERTVLDLLSRDFKHDESVALQFVQLLDAAFRNSNERVRARLLLAPLGRPVRVDAFASTLTLSDGRPGLRIELEPAPHGDAAELDRLRAIFERTPQALALYSENGALLSQNAASEAMFGAEARDSGLADRYGSKKVARDVLRAVLVEGAFNHAHGVFTRYGETRLRVDARRILDPVSGQYAALIHFSDMVEGGEDSQPAIETSPQTFDLGFVELLDAGAAVFDDAFKVLFLTTEARRLLGLSPYGAVPALNDLFPRDQTRFSEAIRALRDGDGSDSEALELRVRAEEGKVQRVRITFRRGQWQGAAAWIATLVDVTAERRAALVGQRVVDDRDQALEPLGLGVVALRADGSLAFASAQAQALLKFPEIPAEPRAFLTADSAQTLQRVLSETTTATTLELNITSGTGLHLSLVDTDAANRNYRLGILGGRDAGFGNSSNTLFGATEAISRASHELRTPLTAILGFTQLMLSAPGPIRSSQYLDYLSDIESSGEYMLRLLQDMLDLRRLEAGAIPINPEPVHLIDLVKTVIRQHDHLASMRDVTITLSAEDGLPTVNIDLQTMRQALMNLVGNAVKFTASPGWVRVSIVARSSGSIEVEVIDNGEGMTHEEQNEALVPFVQGGGNAAGFGGAGMGLPLARGFIEANGAHFELRSNKGLGTIAKVVFPFSLQ